MLPQCKNCHSAFGWKTVCRYLMGFQYQPLNCHDCGQEHFVTVSGRLLNSLLMIGIPMIFVFFLSPFSNIFLTIVIGFCLGFFCSLLSPYFTKLKMDQPSGRTNN
ncbi:TIGR04104 family putative zinc finger protein [[Bacillus] enclensis]|uniref:TIGR04104 family putative zinc finger protein n=1 Tax=[Bacillus] enclensis TaxID=1402860 RepID=UPI003AF85BAC